VLKVVGHVVSTVIAFSGSGRPVVSVTTLVQGFSSPSPVRRVLLHGLWRDEDLFGLVNVMSFFLKEDLGTHRS
jgi:hypothetical protein